MSLKTVELQIAIPRTQDASRIQNELNERSNLANAHALNAVQKEDEKKRSSVIKNEKSAELKMNKEENGNNNHEHSSTNQSETDDDRIHSMTHPYKGHFVDYSG